MSRRFRIRKGRLGLAVLAVVVILWRAFGPTLPWLAPVPDFTSTSTHRLAHVVDGDTIRVRVGTSRDALTVRLVGIDCPERGQPYAAEAASLVRALTEGRELRLSGTRKDRYGRLLAHVDADGVWVNRELVARGAAWVYRGSRDAFSDRLDDAEAEARSSRRGLWALPDPVDPGDWRRR